MYTGGGLYAGPPCAAGEQHTLLAQLHARQRREENLGHKAFSTRGVQAGRRALRVHVLHPYFTAVWLYGARQEDAQWFR